MKKISSISSSIYQFFATLSLKDKCLVIARNFMASTVNSQASLIQMRDFASSTIGFLLGNSSKDKKS